MASFDIIDAAGRGYRMVWQDRAALARLAAGPLLVKTVCYLAVMALGWQQDFVRQALVMLPSYLAEGWLLSRTARRVLTPVDEDGDVNVNGAERRGHPGSLAVTRGAAVYALTRFLLAGFAAVAYGNAADTASSAGTPQGAAALAGGLFLLAGAVWGFRLLWLFIPAALNYPLRAYLAGLGGFSTSLSLIGTWLVCVAPLLSAFTLFMMAVVSPFGGGTSLPAAADFLLGTVHVAADTAVNIVATAGICFGLAALEAGKGRGGRSA